LMGFLRGCIFLTNEGKAELADYSYMALIFLSCPYIPPSFFPEAMHSLLQINPFFSFLEFLRTLWTSPSSASFLAFSQFAVALGAFAVGTTWYWNKNYNTILDRARL